MTTVAQIETKLAEPAAETPGDRFRVGTLRYSVGGLVWVFTWLLWGDFCCTLMENVNIQIVPLRLKQLNAPDWAVPVILSTIPSIINFTLNPIISTYSDRYRSRFGRRIPFLLFSAPLISGTLVLMAFAPEVGAWLHGQMGSATRFSEAGVAVFVVGVLFGAFKVSDMFVNTTFWYLFNDVVPQAFMARFMGLMRVIGSMAAMLFSYFIYEHAMTHMRPIYLGAAAIYLAGFGMMCLMVKEGKYPPPEPLIPRSGSLLTRAISAVRAYASQCLTHRVYVFFFLHAMLFKMAEAATVFAVFLNLSLGITLAQLGMMYTGLQLIQMILGYPVGALADRFHPIRVMVYMKFCLLLVVPLQFVWLFSDFAPQTNYWVLITLTAIDLPVSLMYGAVSVPLMMRLFPRDNFGQFCSFNAMCSAMMAIIGSMGAGLFMTSMRWVFPDDGWGQDFCYRMIPGWRLPCLCLSLVFLGLLYREWMRLGGEKGYSPPIYTDRSV